ncbi:peptidylprolyl isomerase [Actinomycetospora endophytica]|uniref:Peptidylprolyl isomerase n=1 Tax=Actinomycetospora endophytica TaxID=2291215 RepID=A0ABS8PHN6_9PSEU|nr:peptidylprolyl isomerase [Actinomycetospora endophytica]MCD2197781.1 peptidylprolyl isomerase [Actinomycetospora endophytica]
MPTNEQRRKAAKRKLERQIERRAERSRRRRQRLTIGAVVAVVVVVVAAVGIYLYTRPSSSEAAPAAPATAAGACQYTPDGQASRPVQAPDANPARTGTVGLTLQTSQGAIPMTLNRAEAPCAVNAVTSLAQQGFYDNTPCPRLVTGQGLQVLQCGDPTGSGSGGPGYRYAEEPPTNLAPSPLGQGASNYTRGLVAMAKSSDPDTTGSQFFLVYGDSALPPQYTVVGQIAPAGLAVLDRIAAGGDDNSNQAGGGKPNIPVQITKAQLQ